MIRYLDEILVSFGNPSVYVLFVGFLLCFLHITVTFTYYSLYLNFSMMFHCCNSNSTGNYSFPIKNSRCSSIFKNPTLRLSMFDSDLFQDNSGCLEGQIYLLLCFFNCATLFGGIVFGTLGDKAGRRSSLLTALLIHAAVSISLSFVQNYIYFAALYILEGICIAGIQYLSFVLLLEVLPIRYHLSAAVWTVLFRSTGILIFSLLGWLVKKWRYIQLAVSLPGITYLVYLWVLPQSFYWLLSKKKFDLLTSEIERIAGFSGQEMTATIYDKLNSIQKQLTLSDRGPTNKKNLTASPTSKRKNSICIQYFIWLCVGLTFSTTEISSQIKESRMLILFGKALITIGMTIFLYVLVKRIGPKVIQGLLLLAGGIFCISSVAIEEFSAVSYTYGHRHIGIVVLAVFPSLLNVVSSAVTIAVRSCMLYIAAKTFLIETRCFGLGTCSAWESIGHSAAPFLQILLLRGIEFKFQSLCGILMMISGMLTYFLPDYWKADLQEETIQNSSVQTEVDDVSIHKNYISENNEATENRRSYIDDSDAISFSGFFPHAQQCKLRYVDETLV